MRKVPDSIAKRLPRAADIFAVAGFEDARIDDIAEATGIPKATLYYYFAGKEEILGYLLEGTLEKVAVAVGAATEGGGTGADKLARVITAQLRVMAENPAMCLALHEEAGRVTRIPAVAAAQSSVFLLPLEQVLAEGTADGSLRPEIDPEAGATIIFGGVTIMGIGRLKSEDGLSPEAVSDVASQLTSFILHGIGGDAARQPHPADTAGSAGRRANQARSKTAARA